MEREDKMHPLEKRPKKSKPGCLEKTYAILRHPKRAFLLPPGKVSHEARLLMPNSLPITGADMEPEAKSMLVEVYWG